MLSRYVAAGVVNTAATYAIYLLLLACLPYVWAYSVTYAIGLVMGYLLNAYWVFKTKAEAKSAAMYPLAYAINYVLGLALLSVFVEVIGIPRKIAPLVVVVATIPIMYIVMKFVFRRK